MTLAVIVIICIAVVIVLIWRFLARATRRGVTLPARVSVVPISEESEEASFLSSFIPEATKKLMELDFKPYLDFTVPEWSYPGVQRLLYTSDNEYAALLYEAAAVETGFDLVNGVTFHSKLDDETKITTHNGKWPISYISLPNSIISRHPHIEDPKKLFQVHKDRVQKAQKRRKARIQYLRPSNYKYQFTKDWVERMKYNESRGFVKKTDDDTYHGTPKLFLSYIISSVTKRS